VVPADVHLTAGEILRDQSMLTGELVPIEVGVGVQAFAGAVVRGDGGSHDHRRA